MYSRRHNAINRERIGWGHEIVVGTCFTWAQVFTSHIYIKSTVNSFRSDLICHAVTKDGVLVSFTRHLQSFKYLDPPCEWFWSPLLLTSGQNSGTMRVPRYNLQGLQSRSQRPPSFWLATGIETSGQVQFRKSAIHGLPVTLRMLRVKSDKSDWFWSQSIALCFNVVGPGQGSRYFQRMTKGTPGDEVDKVSISFPELRSPWPAIGLVISIVYIYLKIFEIGCSQSSRFRPLVKGNEALGTRLTRSRLAHGWRAGNLNWPIRIQQAGKILVSLCEVNKSGN